MTNLKSLVGSVTTHARVISLPVPCVVGTAMSGGIAFVTFAAGELLTGAGRGGVRGTAAG